MNQDRIQGLSRSLIFLGLLLVSSAVAGMVALIPQLLGGSPMSMESLHPGDWWGLHGQNLISQAVGFGGAVLLARALWGRVLPTGWSKGAATAPVFLLAMVAPLVVAPVMGWSFEVNTALIPEGSMLEAQFKPMEEMLERVTAFLIEAEGGRRIIVILSVALLPAVFEELAFRGGLQPLLIQATGKAWPGIILASIIFSAIHFQFYGFLPRLILGIMFGWLAHRTGSLLPGIIAHFVNNAAAAVTFWVTGSMTDDVFELEVWLVAASLILTAGVMLAVDRLTPPAPPIRSAD